MIDRLRIVQGYLHHGFVWGEKERRKSRWRSSRITSYSTATRIAGG